MVHVFISYMSDLKSIHKNIKLYLITLFIINFGFGIFLADFNLYILAMGSQPDFLGVILSLAPFADAIASIPIGFLAEKIGYKLSFLIVNGVIGISYFLQVISPNKLLIMVGAFTGGLAFCGNFIIQLPFVSHYEQVKKDQAYTLLSLVFYFGMSLGGLVGGAMPGMLDQVILDPVVNFRVILIFASFIIIAGCFPLLFMTDDKPEKSDHISLSPYIHGVDSDTIKFASVELFVGLGLAFLATFLNVIYVYYFNASLELYGVMSALLLIPVTIFLFSGPTIAKKFTRLHVVLFIRLISVFLLFAVVITRSAVIGGSAYILFRSLFGLAQSLWFAYAIDRASKRSRMATASWLEIAFQLGMGISAIVAGQMIADDKYFLLGVISSMATAISFLLTFVFFAGQAEKTA